MTALRWLPTFLGFPLGGFAADLLVGPVDGPGPALIGGAVTGVILGAVQAWAIGTDGPSPRRWILATAAGLAVGLALGAAVVDYGTSIGELTVQGAITGLAVGAAQGSLLRGRLALVWAPALSAAWALGWATTTSIGVDVETQYTIFGSSGALVATVLTAGLLAILGTRVVRSPA
jgi:hypothetical protein